MKKITVAALLLCFMLTSPVLAAKIPLGSYQVSLSRAVSEDNAKNAVLAANSINGSTIWPGQEFSFNQTVGKRTVERGYVNGLMFGQNAVLVKEIGGGVCMTSSILNQAVKAVGLEVVERHNHAARTSYLPLGEDAAVMWGSEDFKFKNNYDDQLMIEAQVSDNNLLVRINRVLPEKTCSLHIVKDNQKSDEDSKLIFDHNTSFIPLRDVTNALGAEIQWDNDTRSVIIKKSNTIISFSIDKPEVVINNNKVVLDVPARIIDDQSMIPVRSTCKALGYLVDWDPVSRTISVKKPVLDTQPEGQPSDNVILTIQEKQ